MTAYLIIRTRITNEPQYALYREAVMLLIESYGGTHLRAGPAQLLEGDEDGSRIALFGFPTMEALNAFWHSDAYRAVKKLRKDAAIMEIWAVPAK
jgi:uncharacterized protein (DUF1330 family)